MRAVIFANGQLSDPAAAARLIQPDDFVIAADGGSHHCRLLGIVPALLVGDLDSMSPQEVARLEAAGCEIHRYPSHKDFTDLELALQHAVRRGAQDILVLGALGARWDQTLANLLLPAAPGLEEVRISLVDGPQEILLLRGGASLEVTGQPGDILSLIPLGGDAGGIVTEGLEYPLRDETLIFGATRGISNVLLHRQAVIHLATGLLLVVLIHDPAAF